MQWCLHKNWVRIDFHSPPILIARLWTSLFVQTMTSELGILLEWVTGRCLLRMWANFEAQACKWARYVRCDGHFSKKKGLGRNLGQDLVWICSITTVAYQSAMQVRVWSEQLTKLRQQTNKQRLVWHNPEQDFVSDNPGHTMHYLAILQYNISCLCIHSDLKVRQVRMTY